jgi:peptidoglycan-N-acetylglucosamine deacetylase
MNPSARSAPGGAPHAACFSLDIEDWHHSQLLPVSERHPHATSVVRAGTEQILTLLARHRARATFFVLGEIVRDHPDLVRRMLDEGHELGCHGMRHEPLWGRTPEAFAAELQEFCATVTDALGAFPVAGFRAPTFSLDRRTAWALDVLRAHGYAYDSSVFPARVRMYGVPDAPLGIWRPARGDFLRHDPDGTLVEFPVAVARFGPLRLPVAGGFYLRALPFGVFERALGRVLAERPAALYLHPRECRPEPGHVAMPATSAWITYVGLDTVAWKLERLLARWPFVPMREALEQAGWLVRAGRAAGA